MGTLNDITDTIPTNESYQVKLFGTLHQDDISGTNSRQEHGRAVLKHLVIEAFKSGKGVHAFAERDDVRLCNHQARLTLQLAFYIAEGFQVVRPPAASKITLKSDPSALDIECHNGEFVEMRVMYRPYIKDEFKHTRE